MLFEKQTSQTIDPLEEAGARKHSLPPHLPIPHHNLGCMLALECDANQNLVSINRQSKFLSQDQGECLYDLSTVS